MADVKITLKEMDTGAKKELRISVDPETFYVATAVTKDNIEWALDVSAAPGWAFDDNGIDMRGAPFQHTHGHAADVTYGHKRTQSGDNRRYKYKINLKKTDGTTLVWDPFIVNN